MSSIILVRRASSALLGRALPRRMVDSGRALRRARGSSLPGIVRNLAALLLLVAAQAQPATLASWNVRHLGQGEHKDYAALAAVVETAAFDFVAVQEAMSTEGVEALLRAIERATGTRWAAIVSHDLGRSSYKEKYAFLWNPEVVEYAEGAVVYLDVTDQFAREPYSARFRLRASNTTFVVATVHVLHGRSVEDRTREVDALAEYWRWLREVYPDEAGRVLLMGDFNLSPRHPAWATLGADAKPLIVRGATTLSTIDGRFANLYDNIFVPRTHALPIAGCGIFAFPAVLGLSHEAARRTVSDHAPVWVRLAPGAHGGKRAAGVASDEC